MVGFTKIDNPILEKFLGSDLTKRQLKILLLIARFSFGYQKTYALLRRDDFSYAGVSPSCITQELKKLAQLRVIGWDPARDMAWINADLEKWAVESPVDNRQRFFKIAAKNSTKWQLALYQNPQQRLDETSSRERKRKINISKDSFFLRVLTDYFLKIAPLSREEAEALREIVRRHDVLTVTRAIHAAALHGERAFPGFLKELDRTAGGFRHGGISRIGSNLQRFLGIPPRG